MTNIRYVRNPHKVKSPMLVVGLSLSNKRMYYKTKWSCLKASGIVLRRKMNWQKWKILLHYCKWSWLWPFQPIKCPPLPITENKLFRPKAFQNKSQKKEGSGMKSFRAIILRNKAQRERTPWTQQDYKPQNFSQNINLSLLAICNLWEAREITKSVDCICFNL